MKKELKEESWPTLSFIVCTMNCRDDSNRCFKSIVEQDYPKSKVEMIAIDGYSTDGTLDVLKKYGVKIIKSKERPEGLGAAKWIGYRKAKGEIVIYIDSDNALMQKDWAKQMVYPLIADKSIGFAICRMHVEPSDIALNRYLSRVGTDPVAAYLSMDFNLATKKIALEDHNEYWTYNITPHKFYVVGGYYLAAKKKTLDKIGGYTQDTEVVYNLARKGLAKVAIPKKATIHHKISSGIISFTKKKYKWSALYFRLGYKNRAFSWIPSSPSDKFKLALRLGTHLIFIPDLIFGVKWAFKDRDFSWLLHPVMTWLTTIAYILAYARTRHS